MLTIMNNNVFLIEKQIVFFFLAVAFLYVCIYVVIVACECLSTELDLCYAIR